jgi:pilus assembly protein Flp/PilA
MQVGVLRGAVESYDPSPKEPSRRPKMNINVVLTFLSRLHKDEEGQGLVEYLLILALVAFAATAGMGSLASYLNVAFSDVGSLLNSYIS